MKHVVFFRSNPLKINSITLCLFDKMLDFTKTASCLVIGTVQQIDTMLMHPSEKCHQNLLAKPYSMKDFNFQTHKLKQKKL